MTMGPSAPVRPKLVEGYAMGFDRFTTNAKYCSIPNVPEIPSADTFKVLKTLKVYGIGFTPPIQTIL